MTPKQPLPTWLLCVWVIPGFRTCYQVDMVDAAGVNHGSTNPDALRSQGYAMPEISHLPHGQFSFAQILTP
jgi:hypothetical protein